MKNVKRKLALMVGGAVLLTLAAVLGAFNWAMHRQMDERAQAALDSALYWASILYLDDTANDTDSAY